MALNVFELFGKITIDSSGAKSGLDSAVGHAQKAESKLAATFKKIGTAVAAAFTVKAIVDFGKQCTQAAADIAAEESAFAQIMGDYAGTAQQKLDAVSKATGVASTRMTSAFTSMTAKFKGLGEDTADATTLASDGLMIMADAAAFCNMSFSEAQSHLNSFINGSYEGGEAISLFANDTQMAAWAIEQGLAKDKKAWAEMNEGMKQTIRLQYAMAKYKESGIWGQSLVEAEEYGNVMGNLTEAWRQFQGVIGKPILEKIVLPAMRTLTRMMPGLTQAVQVGIDWLSEGFDKFASYFTNVFTPEGLNLDALPNAIAEMFKDLGRSIPDLLVGLGKLIGNVWEYAVWPLLSGLFEITFGIEMPSWDETVQAVEKWWNDGGLAESIAAVCNWTLNLFGAPATVTKADIENALGPWWTETKSLVSNFCSWLLQPFGPPEEMTDTSVSGLLSAWWGKTQGLVQGFCKWMLAPYEGIIGNPTEVVSAWWEGGVKDSVQNACKWVLNIFGSVEGDPAEAVSAWWAGVVKSVQDACKWVLNLFSPPTGDAAGVVSTWWSGVVKSVQDACKWVLNLFSPPTGDAAGVVSAWWSGVVESVQNACKWVLKIFDPPTENPVTVITDWWNGVKASIANICKAPVKAEGEPVSSARSRIQSWWNSVKSGLNLAVQATVNVVQSIVGFGGGSGSFGGRGSASGTGFTSGAMVATPDSNSSFDKFFNSHATGLDYVPYDNYLARLHKGEAVLTSSEADVWRGGGSGRVEAALTQMNEVLRVIAQNTGADKQVVLDTGAVVGQLAPGIDAQLGMYMTRKGRRN